MRIESKSSPRPIRHQTITPDVLRYAVFVLCRWRSTVWCCAPKQPRHIQDCHAHSTHRKICCNSATVAGCCLRWQHEKRPINTTKTHFLTHPKPDATYRSKRPTPPQSGVSHRRRTIASHAGMNSSATVQPAGIQAFSVLDFLKASNSSASEKIFSPHFEQVVTP